MPNTTPKLPLCQEETDLAYTISRLESEITEHHSFVAMMSQQS